MHPLDSSPLLGARTWQGARTPVLLVPVGSTEQHGPHLPVSVDTTVAMSVASGLVEHCRAEGIVALVAPAVAYGASGEHEGFPGTISIGTEALALLLLEYGRSASAWADRIVFVNGHGGNLDALARAVPGLRGEGRDAAWLPCGVRGGDAHAGRTETSLIAHLTPDEVRWGLIEPGEVRPLAEVLPQMQAEGVRAVSPNGVLGDPTGASAAEGEQLLAAMVEAAWRRLSRGAVAANGCLLPDSAAPEDVA